MPIPKFGLNRFDSRSVAGFAADVKRAESLGWDIAFQNAAPLGVRDPFVTLAAAAAATERIGLSPLIVEPVTRHPASLASSAATVEEMAPGRTLLGLGSGDNAVRQLGLRPATVGEFEAATRMIKELLAGEAVEVGPSRPAQMRHHRPVPVWIAAGGPRTLRMAGAYADGVFIRVGKAAASIAAALGEVRTGAAGAGRDPDSVGLGIIVDTVLGDDRELALLMAKSIAAGYHELTPMQFDRSGLSWDGPPVAQLRQEHGIWPDFHHNRDLAAGGGLLDFLPEAAADLFTFWGGPRQVIEQAASFIRSVPARLDYVVLPPIPDPTWPDAGEQGYTHRMATEVLPALREQLAD